jgi:TetR/AcrR family transcriptional repressor of nem operon
MTTATRQRILEAGAQLIHRQGFNHTGIQEILQAAGVPKGSFYFYFKSKEEFGLALIDFFGQFWRAKAEEFLDDQSQPPLARLQGLFAWFLAYFKQTGCVGGCPVGNLAQEMGDVSPAFGQRLSQAIDFMAGRVAETLEEARQAGQLAPDRNPRELAYFIIASWQGALIRMKALKSAEPLEVFQQVVFDQLLAR